MSEKAEITETEFGEQEPWSKKRLGDIFENIYSGGTPKKGVDEFYNGDIPFVKIEDLNAQKSGGVTTAEEHITEQAIEETSVRAFEKGTLLFTIYGSLAETALVRSEVATNQAILGLWGAKKDNVLYVKYAIDKHQPRLESLSRQTTQANLGKGIVEKYQIPTPPLEEQRKIASVLYTVDQAIQQTEEIINQTKVIRKGVVQTVLRFGTETHTAFQDTVSGQYPNEWEIVKFEELIDDTRYGTDNKSNTNGEGYPTLRIPNVVEKRITTSDLKHTPLENDEFERLRLRDSDILLIRTNGNPDYVGRCATFTEKEEPFVFASYLIRLRVDNSRIRPAFVREFLNSHRGRNEMSGWIRSSAGNYNLSVGAIEKFDIPVPSLDEQDTIIKNIQQIDDATRANEQGLYQLKLIKHGLMQDLLSGEVRTHNKDIEIVDEVLAHG